jgi:hypothetical protein
VWPKLKNWVDTVLFGSVFKLRCANRIVQSKMDNCKDNAYEEDPRLELSEERLDSFLDISIERVYRVEGKAMSTLLGVGVAIAVLGVTSGLLGPSGVLGNYSIAVRIVVAAILVIAMVFLFGSGYLALRAYSIGRIYRPTLKDYEPLVEPSSRKQVQLYCIEQNYRVATLRLNRLSVSFNCLRNGLAMVVLIGILIVIVALLDWPKSAGA